MKTQTDKANLGRLVVQSIPGRGSECEVHGVNDGNRVQPWGFVCSKGNGLQSNTGYGKKGGASRRLQSRFGVQTQPQG